MNKPATPGKKTGSVRKRIVQAVPSGIAHVKATFNNTIVVITNPKGQVISWASAGKAGFSGSRKSSAYAANMAAQDAARTAATCGVKEVSVRLCGAGAGRESAVKGLQSSLDVTEIVDTTPVPHNGCKARKRRRV